jgi:carbonic anhydrase
MKNLTAISSETDIFNEYADTPIGLLLKYHNLGRPLDSYTNAQLLIGMCMDNRKRLHIPDNFAFILRTGGGNLRNSEFKVSYAIAVGGVKTIALIAHNQCGMVNLASKKQAYINGLIEFAGWDKERAEENFLQFAPLFEIEDEIDFTVLEAKRLRNKYPKILIVPLLYKLEDNLLYLINE